MVRYRLVLRSTETRPSQEVQESVLPALSQRFGSRVDLTATDLDPDQRLQAAVVGHADVDTVDALCDTYGYLQSHSLVRVADVKTNDAGALLTRKSHEVDRDLLDRRPRVDPVGTVEGDVLIRVAPPPDAE
jgi:hypothetical protein